MKISRFRELLLVDFSYHPPERAASGSLHQNELVSLTSVACAASAHELRWHPRLAHMCIKRDGGIFGTAASYQRGYSALAAWHRCEAS